MYVCSLDLQCHGKHGTKFSDLPSNNVMEIMFPNYG